MGRKNRTSGDSLNRKFKVRISRLYEKSQQRLPPTNFLGAYHAQIYLIGATQMHESIGFSFCLYFFSVRLSVSDQGKSNCKIDLSNCCHLSLYT